MRKLPTDKRGYVLAIRCGKYHSGNLGLVQDGAYCSCMGCQTFYSTSEVWAAFGQGGEPGHGKLYSVGLWSTRDIHTGRQS